MARQRVWTDFLVIAAIVLIVAGTVWLYFTITATGNAQSGVPEAIQAVKEKIPTQTVLPDVSPVDCKVRVHSAVSDTQSYVSVHNKADGAVCEDVCLSGASPRTCENGACSGVCAGQCSKQFEFDPLCPSITVSDILVNTFFVYNYYYQLCTDGICTYYVLFDPTYFVAFGDAHYVDFYAHGSSVAENSADRCLDFIADSEISKGCLVPSFTASMSALQTTSAWSACTFQYACGRASLYAGQSSDDGNVFFFKRGVNGIRTTHSLSGLRIATETISEILEARANNQTTSAFLRGPAVFERPRGT